MDMHWVITTLGFFIAFLFIPIAVSSAEDVRDGEILVHKARFQAGIGRARGERSIRTGYVKASIAILCLFVAALLLL